MIMNNDRKIMEFWQDKIIINFSVMCPMWAQMKWLSLFCINFSVKIELGLVQINNLIQQIINHK